MTAITQNITGGTHPDDAFDVQERPARVSILRMPPRPASPKGMGQGPMRDLLSLIARHSESYAFRFDGGEWEFSTTNREMLRGRIEALVVLGITCDDRIEQTDLPTHFLIVGKDGTKRTIEFTWDSIDYDMQSMPPHVKRLGHTARAAVLIGACVLLWAAIYGVAKLIFGF
jgi:hypothetical protein